MNDVIKIKLISNYKLFTLLVQFNQPQKFEIREEEKKFFFYNFVFKRILYLKHFLLKEINFFEKY